MMTVNLAIGTITPPVAVNLYVASRIAETSMEEVSRWVHPRPEPVASRRARHPLTAGVDTLTIDVTIGAILNATTGNRLPAPRVRRPAGRFSRRAASWPPSGVGSAPEPTENLSFFPKALDLHPPVTRQTVTLKSRKNGLFVCPWHGVC